MAKLAKWAERVAPHAHSEGGVKSAAEKGAIEEAETRRMVSDALDRAQLYISSMIASSAGGGGEWMAKATSLAKEYYDLASAFERPMSVDILALASPTANVELRVRLMTGEETTVLVPAYARKGALTLD